MVQTVGASSRLHSLSLISTALLGVLKEIAANMRSYADAPSAHAISKPLKALSRAASFCGFWGVSNFLSALIELSSGIEAVEPNTVNRSEHLDRIKALTEGVLGLAQHLEGLAQGNVVSYGALNEAFRRVIRKARPALLEVSVDEITPFLFMPAPASLEVEAEWVANEGASHGALLAALLEVQSTEQLKVGAFEALMAANPYRTLSGLFMCVCAPAAQAVVNDHGQDFVDEFRRLSVLLGDGVPVQPPAPNGFLMSRLLYAVATSEADDSKSAAVRARYALMRPRDASVSMHDVAKRWVEGMNRFEGVYKQATSTRTPSVVAKMSKAVDNDCHVLGSAPFSSLATQLAKLTSTWQGSDVSLDAWILGSAYIALMSESANTWGNVEAQEKLLAQATQLEADGVILPCETMQAKIRAKAVVKVRDLLEAQFKKINLSIESALRAVFDKDLPEANAARIADVAGGPLSKHLSTISGMAACIQLPKAAEFAARVSARAAISESWTTQSTRTALFEDLSRVNLFIGRLRPGSLLDMDAEEMGILKAEQGAQVINLFTREEVQPLLQQSSDAAVADEVLRDVDTKSLPAEAVGVPVVDQQNAGHSDLQPTAVQPAMSEAPASLTEEAPIQEPELEVDHGVDAADHVSTPDVELQADEIVAMHDVSDPFLALGDAAASADDFDIGEELPGFMGMADAVDLKLPSVDELLADFLAAQDGRVNQLQGDTELLAIMFEESWQCLDGIDDAFAGVRALDGNPDHVADCRRLIHTLKGVNRTCGMDAAGAILHVMEDRLDAMADDSTVMEPVLQAFVSAMAVVREQLENARTEYQSRGLAQADEAPAAEKLNDVAPPAAEDDSVIPDEHLSAVEVAELEPEITAPEVARPAGPIKPAGPVGTVRIPVHLADKVGRVSSKVIAATRQAHEDLASTIRQMRELEENLRRMLPDIRILEIMASTSIASASAGSSAGQGFDALELDRYTELQEVTRRLAESFGDALASAKDVSDSLGRANTSEEARVLLSDDLQRGSSELLLAPVATQRARFERVVAKACEDTGKAAELVIDGAARVPAAAMDKLMPVFEHLLRNSIAHGVEDQAARVAAGKAPVGLVEIKVAASEASEGGIVRIAVRDDGAGIDLGKVLEIGKRKGLVKQDAKLSDDAIRELLFASGFSTAGQVSELAGRGVGLDVVRAALNSLGGFVSVNSTAGQGTEFILTLPTDSSTMSVVPVTAGGFKCLLPITLVRRIVTVSAGSEVEVNREAGKAVVGGVEYELVELANRVPAGTAAAASGRGHLVLVKSSNVTKAVLVDSVGNQSRMVVKPLGPFVRDIPGMIGGTTLPNGAAGLVVNPLALKEISSSAKSVDQVAAVRRAMVVDDSSTVRLMTSRFFKKHGFAVSAARDGLEALRDISTGVKPNLFVFDLEMPGMNGFELISEIRRMEEFSATPIIVITSRTADKHRDRAMELGATAYLAKPFEESQMLELVMQLTGAVAA
ncbi:response regulator [Roseateles asaccharophilus]|uniref:hybrid sensor histidine kinase/response regulator n=1 Tax=Roseateles asaccharophilus TaxID=582607 RepID=UPI0038511616